MSIPPETDAPTAGPQKKAIRILVVEDDPSLATMLSWELEELGVDTLVANSCREALRLAEQIPFDLALVDADLPDGDGISLAESLSRLYPAAVVALCSGRHGIPDTLGGLGPTPTGVRAVLVKPVAIARMLELLPAATD